MESGKNSDGSVSAAHAAPTPPADAASEREEVDEFYFGLPDTHDSLEDVKSILKLRDTTRDKLVFTVYTVNAIISAFSAGYVPQYYYIVHTYKAILLISYRWYSYKKMKLHYYLFDFCYFTNLLSLVYFWMPISSPVIRGTLFTVVFAFAFGPILVSIAFWRNSFVPHSNEKMTNIFVHLSPAVSLWGVRWHSTAEQGFPLCGSPTYHGPGGCSDVGAWEFMVYPILVFIVWELLYFLMLEVFGGKRIEKRNYVTSPKYFASDGSKKLGLVHTVVNIFGPKHRKMLYYTQHFFHTATFIPVAYLCYLSSWFTIAYTLLFLTVASYNGATFYIDVFSRRYYYDKVLNVKPEKKGKE